METADNNNQTQKTIKIEPTNKKNLARMLGVSVYVVTHYIDALQPELGMPVGTMYSTQQVLMIVRNYSLPGKFILNVEMTKEMKRDEKK